MPGDSNRPSSFVTPKVHVLQEGYLHDSSASRAVLAQLRRAATGEPGTAWEISEFLLPESEYFSAALRSGSPQAARADYSETAIHIAMTTYASLQQGKGNGMHVNGRAFGEAARLLAAHPEEQMDRGRVWERLARLAQAQTVSGLRWQLRSFASLLRRRSIGLDIGQLADDIYFWQMPSVRSGVQRAWSRQFFHRPKSEPETTSDTVSN